MNKNQVPCDLLPVARILSFVSKTYYGALTKELEHLDIDRHFSVLIAIENSNEKCTQQFLGEQLKIDKVSMVRVLDYLVEKNYIIRTVNPSDRREHLVSLTSKAQKVLPEIHAAVEKINRFAFQGMDKKQIECFNEVMKKMYKNLKDLPSDPVIVNYRKRKTKK